MGWLDKTKHRYTIITFLVTQHWRN